MQCKSTYPFYDKMDNCIEKEGCSNDHIDGKKSSVGCGHPSGHQKCKGRKMKRRATVEQLESRKTAAGQAQSYIFDQYDREGFSQLSQEAAASILMHITDSEQLNSSSEDEDVQKPSQSSILAIAGRARGLDSKK